MIKTLLTHRAGPVDDSGHSGQSLGALELLVSPELGGDGRSDESIGAGDEDTHQHQERPVPGQAGVVKEVSSDRVRGQEAPGVTNSVVTNSKIQPKSKYQIYIWFWKTVITIRLV